MLNKKFNLLTFPKKSTFLHKNPNHVLRVFSHRSKFNFKSNKRLVLWFDYCINLNKRMSVQVQAIRT